MPVDPSDIVAIVSSAVTGAVGWLTGRRRTLAETRTVEARADLAQVETVEHLLAEYRRLTAEYQQLAAVAAASAAASRAAEAECVQRAERIEAELHAEREERRAEVRRLVERIRLTHPTPRLGHSAVTIPADPLETPPDGHRLSAPSLPTREDTDPTPDLHASVTPRSP